MTHDCHIEEAANIDTTVNSMDRRIIRVDIPPTYAGITAALRRAFSPVAMEQSDGEFSELLRKLS